MAKNIKNRIEALETASPDADHDWTIEVFMDEKGHVRNRYYRDGIEVRKARFDREHKPKPGDPIEVTLDWEK